MEQNQEEQPEYKKPLSVDDYERVGREATQKYLNEFAFQQRGSNSESNNVVEALDSSPLYRGSVGSIIQRASIAEMIIRGLILLTILLVASSVFQSERLSEETYDGLRQVLGGVLPRMIARVSILFSNIILLILLCLVDVTLLALYLYNEGSLALLKTHPFLRSFYRGFLFPVMIVAAFVITFGGWVLLTDHDDQIKMDFGVQESEETMLDRKAEIIANGIARCCSTPVIGDIISASALVAVMPCISFSLPCGTLCTIFAIFILGTVVTCFLEIWTLLFEKASLRNVLFTVALLVCCFLDLTIRDYYPKFTFGFALIVLLHLIQFLDVVFDFSSWGSSVSEAADNDRSRYPSNPEFREDGSLVEPFDEELKKVKGLINCRDIVVYVGNEVAREGGYNREKLSFFNIRALWDIFPTLAAKFYKKHLLIPICRHKKGTTSQKYIGRLVDELSKRGVKVTVGTDCVDGKLTVPPAVNFLELRGNVSRVVCSDGHMAEMTPEEQCERDDFVCEICKKPLATAMHLGSDFDQSAFGQLAEAISSLQSDNGCLVVFGACDNSQVKELIVNQHKAGVPLVQVGSSGFIHNANVLIPAPPRNVLFEIVDELPDEEDN